MQSLLGAPTPTPPKAPQTIELPSNLGRFNLEMVPSPSLGMTEPGLYGSHTVYITDSGDSLSAELAQSLQQHGINATVVAAVPEAAQAVVFLGGLKQNLSEEDSLNIQKEAFQLARQIAPTLSQNGGLLVSVQDTGGAFGTTKCPPERVYLGGLAALIKTASQEWPLASLKAIDLERANRSPTELAKILLEELLFGGGNLEVSLRANHLRQVPTSIASLVEPKQSTIQANETVVVSGGARGVTAACVIAWAQESKGRFVLLGRTELVDEPQVCEGTEGDANLKRALLLDAKNRMQKITPAGLSKQVKQILACREIKATLAAVASVGGEAQYRSVDVTNQASVVAALDAVRAQWGPIHGLLHGAGVLADRLIAEQSDEQFDWVFNTKIQGLRVLLSALSTDPLKVLCFFSSVAARCGNKGQVAYAMANEILNKVAWSRYLHHGEKLLVKSLGWGPWAGGMVSPQLIEHFTRLGVPLIPLDVGAKMLADEMKGANPNQVELVLGGEPRQSPLLIEGGNAPPLNYEINLSQKSHPYLAGHSIEGSVVVPVVLALEWFSRIARSYRKDLHLESIMNLKVLCGIKLLNFENGGDRIVITCQEKDSLSGTYLALEIKGSSGRIYYSAQAKMVTDSQSLSQPKRPTLDLGDWGEAPIYGDVLFHSDDFQVIEGINGIGANGISGTLNGVETANWRWEDWNTDVAAMDGGLQMLLLWARENMGGAAIPMAIGEAFFPESKPQSGRINCFAQCRTNGKNRGLANIVFQDEKNTSIAEFKNVELILRPTLQ